jgi:hypothetical protein
MDNTVTYRFRKYSRGGRRYKSDSTDGQDNTTPNATKYFGGRRIRKSLNDKRRYCSRKSRSRNRRNKY